MKNLKMGNRISGYDLLDKAVLPISRMMECVSDVEGIISGEDSGFSMSIEKIVIDLPAEFDVITDEGRLVLGATPPTQKIETTFMPVFHRLKVTIASIAHDNE